MVNLIYLEMNGKKGGMEIYVIQIIIIGFMNKKNIVIVKALLIKSNRNADVTHLGCDFIIMTMFTMG